MSIWKQFILFMMIIVALMLAIMLTSCNSLMPASTVPPSPVNANVKSSLNIKVDGIVQYGTALLDKKNHYIIEVPLSLLDGKPLKLFFSSCHRSFEVSGLQSKDVYKYDYYPVVGLEDTGSCLVFISTITDTGISN